MIFITGDCHQNFDRLYKYPVEEWRGGKVHKIRPSVIHLMRGQVFDKELNKGSLPYRINHVSWWAQELPSKEEMKEGRRKLEAHDNRNMNAEEILLYEQIIRIA